jgi:parallel beta-helix repeat protein
MRRTLIATAAMLAVAAAVPAAAATCPALDARTLGCQTTVARAAYTYTRGSVAAIQSCLRRIHRGRLVGDPIALCRGAGGAPPADARTATRLQRQRARLSTRIAGRCADAAVAQLDLCAATAAGLPACLADAHRETLDAAIEAAHGPLAATADPRLHACQDTIARQAAKYLALRLKTTQACLDARNRTCGDAAPLARCLGATPEGGALEAAVVARLALAEAGLRTTIDAGCSDAEVAALAACGDSRDDVTRCLVCAHGNAADLLLAHQYRAVRAATPVTTMQAVVNAADAGDTVLLAPGTYEELVTIGRSGLALIGQRTCDTGARAVLVNPAPGIGPNGISSCGSRSPGCGAPADDLLFQGFEVRYYKDNGILTTGAEGVVYRDIVAVGEGTPTGMEYGIFPLLSNDVLVEKSVVTGVRDAGIYVGQSTNIEVRLNEVYGNVAGIEIENSANAKVYENHAHDNTGGILLFKLAGLGVQLSSCHEVYDNVSENNNLPNFGSGIVSMVPRGTGLMILSNDAAHVHDNVVTGNDTFGLAVTDQVTLNLLFDPDPFPTPSPDATTADNYFVDNVMTGNGGDPDPAAGGFAADALVVALGGGTGNCQHGNTYATEVGFAALPPCGAPPPPGCPYVPPATTTSTTLVSATTTTTSTLASTWTAIQGLFADACVNCHTAGKEQYGLGHLDDYDQGYALLVGVPSSELPAMNRVEPFDSTLSYLMHKLDGTHTTLGCTTPPACGSQMPVGAPLSEAERDAIRAWIDGGAPKD